jgi:hypothetical protein
MKLIPLALVAAVMLLTVQSVSGRQPSQQQQATQTLTLTVAAAHFTDLAIDTMFMPSAFVGIPYTTGFQAHGGAPPYTWSLAVGSTLPLGLSLTTVTGMQTTGGSPPITLPVNEGQIYGTPTTAGTYSFTIQVTDSALRTRRLLVSCKSALR